MIDLNKLPFPEIIESLDYDLIKQKYVDNFIAEMPDYANIDNESDPITKLIGVCAYREMMIRNEINQKAKACFINYATGADLDNLVAEYNIERQIITEADETTTPITPAIYESDDRLRKRAILAWEGITTAGSEKSYIYHAINADTRVKDVKVISPSPSEIEIYLLSTETNGSASDELVNSVSEKLSDEKIRPLGDRVQVQSAGVIDYEIEATIKVVDELDDDKVLEQVISALEEYTEQQKIGKKVAISGIYDVLHQQGVETATLTKPLTNVLVSETEFAYCSNIAVSFE